MDVKKAGKLILESIANYVFAHFQSAQSCLLAVVVHILVLPTVAEVAFPGKETHKTTFPNKSEAFGGLVVVFVYFWQAIGKVVFLMIDGMVEG